MSSESDYNLVPFLGISPTIARNLQEEQSVCNSSRERKPKTMTIGNSTLKIAKKILGKPHEQKYKPWMIDKIL
jgi:hypothetical protein